jgi:kynurenine formamidase
MIGNMRVVDLTQPLDATTVMWPGAPQPTADTILTVAHDGFYNRKISFMEHSGTHFDAPCHMVEGTKSVDEIAADRLVRPSR